MSRHAHAHGAGKIHVKHFGENIRIELLVPADDARGIHNNVKFRKAVDQFFYGFRIGYVHNLRSPRGGRRFICWQTGRDYIRTRERKGFRYGAADSTCAASDKRPLSAEIEHASAGVCSVEHGE